MSTKRISTFFNGEGAFATKKRKHTKEEWDEINKKFPNGLPKKRRLSDGRPQRSLHVYFIRRSSTVFEKLPKCELFDDYHYDVIHPNHVHILNAKKRGMRRPHNLPSCRGGYHSRGVSAGGSEVGGAVEALSKGVPELAVPQGRVDARRAFLGTGVYQNDWSREAAEAWSGAFKAYVRQGVWPLRIDVSIKAQLDEEVRLRKDGDPYLPGFNVDSKKEHRSNGTLTTFRLTRNEDFGECRGLRVKAKVYRFVFNGEGFPLEEQEEEEADEGSKHAESGSLAHFDNCDNALS